jgi:hypothetical protein
MPLRVTRGFGVRSQADCPYDISFGVKPGTEHSQRPAAAVYSYTPQGSKWLKAHLDAINERCEQVWADNSKDFLFDTFAAFSVQACNCGLAVRVAIPDGRGFIANPERETKPNHTPGGLR